MPPRCDCQPPGTITTHHYPPAPPCAQLLAARGDWQRALALQRAMGLAKVRPDSQTAQLLVTACARGGNHPLAAQLAAELAAQGLLPPPGAPPPPTDGAPWLEAHSRSSSSSGATDGSARTDGSAAAAGARGDGPKQQQALLASGRRA